MAQADAKPIVHKPVGDPPRITRKGSVLRLGSLNGEENRADGQAAIAGVCH